MGKPDRDAWRCWYATRSCRHLDTRDIVFIMADCHNHEHSDSEDPEDETNSDFTLRNKRLGETTLDAYYRRRYHLHLKPIKREDVAKWARLIEGDPNRVVSVLRLCKQGASNIWDDTERVSFLQLCFASGGPNNLLPSIAAFQLEGGSLTRCDAYEPIFRTIIPR